MQDKRHLEYKVTLHPKTKKIVKKELTDRGHVMISEKDAKTNNDQMIFTFLYYELESSEKAKSQMNKTELQAVLTKKEISFDESMTKKQLIELI